jgi:hypothetical protein
MNAPQPNPRLQRTPSASPPSPLSRQPLGATWKLGSVVLAALLLAGRAPAAEVRFPGHARAVDPTGRVAVVYRELSACGSENPHELSVVDLPTGTRTLLLTFPRGASVLWDSFGTAFAVTDWGGSDFSTVRVFFADRARRPVDVNEELRRTVGLAPALTGNHHVYVEAVKWQTRQTLRFRVRGYGDRDPNGFEQLFDYSLGGKITRVGHARSK